ncbi:ArsR/SmtB family transcription factor [Pelistega europaea]|uniref:Helix-turn-helix transcriptional regulator n=1 Tax=Pelistega europaea TaxID=106147 RepID=A0A7Y4L9S5_9BURK|nr:helix-turn-helix domain-containing protein [Pelistega europaea]NOL49595.1 helix-turn-helix transcriptional regulator [Pelistega europaea]
MTEQQASRLFESLSSPIRLKLFLQLTTAGTKGIVAGDLAKTLDLRPNNLSFHLNSLSKAGLIFSQTEGRFIRYFANLDLMTEFIQFLTQNCCKEDKNSIPCCAFYAPKEEC